MTSCRPLRDLLYVGAYSCEYKAGCLGSYSEILTGVGRVANSIIIQLSALHEQPGSVITHSRVISLMHTQSINSSIQE